jgi:F0F1-type ATP synthase alpha subunit
VLDFEKHSASEHYIDTLPPETQQAIKEKKAIDDEMKGKLNSAIQEFKSRFVQDQSHKAAAARK